MTATTDKTVEPRAVPEARMLAEAAGLGREFQRLKGAVTTAGWLPSDSGHEVLDELRAEHHRHLTQVARALDATWGPLMQAEREDRQHAAALRNALATGTTVPADKRTPPAQRRAALERLEAPRLAAIGALSDFIDHAIQTLRDHEGELRGAIAEQLNDAKEAKRAAEARLRQAEAVETSAWKRDGWLRGAIADQGPPQPAEDSDDVIESNATIQRMGGIQASERAALEHAIASAGGDR